jgi:hypothetical protein
MESRSASRASRASRASMHRTDQWQSLAGEVVEVWLGGAVYRKGLVDDAMPDASGLWLAWEGAFPRQFIDAASGFEVWTTLYPRSGRDGVTQQPDSTRAQELPSATDRQHRHQRRQRPRQTKRQQP